MTISPEDNAHHSHVPTHALEHANPVLLAALKATIEARERALAEAAFRSPREGRRGFS